MVLTEREKKILAGLEKQEKALPIIYTMICLNFGLAITFFAIGCYFKSKDGFLGTLYFSTLGTFILTGILSQRRLYRIIKKLQGSP